MAIDASDANLPLITVDEEAAAALEDERAELYLQKISKRGPVIMTTPESIRLGDEIVACAVRDAVRTLVARVAAGELLTLTQFQHELGSNRQAINTAVKSNRVFVLTGPSGEDYFPAFYADPTLDRNALGEVSQALAALPAPSKYHFFTAKRFSPGGTPLNAIRNGQAAEVLALAISYAETRPTTNSIS